MAIQLPRRIAQFFRPGYQAPDARGELGLGSAATHPDTDFAPASTATTLASHVANVANPHAVTKTQVGLPLVPNVDATQRANHQGTQAANTISDLAEAVDDRVAALLVAGTGISLGYSDPAGTLTINATASGGATLPSTNAILKGDGSGGAVAATAGTDYPGLNTVNTWSAQQNFRSAKFQGISSTSAIHDTALIDSGFVVNTDATRTGYLDIYAADYTGTNKRGLRVESDGDKALVTCYATVLMMPSSFALGAGSHGTLGAVATAIGDSATAAGAGASSFGNGATASGPNSTALGRSAVASEDGSLAVAGVATGVYAVAVGRSCTASGFASFAIGGNTVASGVYAVGLGYGSMASHDEAMAIGHGAVTTADHQIMLGTQSETVVMPGNAAIGGTGKSLGFYGTPPVAKPVFTYSRATENAAQTQQRQALVALGLATDSTTA